MDRSNEAPWCRKTELSAQLIQKHKEPPHETYVSHWPDFHKYCVDLKLQFQRELAGAGSANAIERIVTSIIFVPRVSDPIFRTGTLNWRFVLERRLALPNLPSCA